MNELIHLLLEWEHWAFEIISGGVFLVAGMIIPERFNFAKRWLVKHDHEKHGVVKDDAEERMTRLDALLDELDEKYGPPSEEALARARAAFGG